jgi:hypothetical protein
MTQNKDLKYRNFRRERLRSRVMTGRDACPTLDILRFPFEDSGLPAHQDDRQKNAVGVGTCVTLAK